MSKETREFGAAGRGGVGERFGMKGKRELHGRMTHELFLHIRWNDVRKTAFKDCNRMKSFKRMPVVGKGRSGIKPLYPLLVENIYLYNSTPQKTLVFCLEVILTTI